MAAAASNSITGNPVQAVEPAPTGFSSGRLAPTPFGQVAVSAGAFADGNAILGVGVRVVSGGSIAGFKPTLRRSRCSPSRGWPGSHRSHEPAR